MRCPECNQRNSVAAKKCAACASALRRKPLPLGLKIFVGTLASITFIFCVAALSTALVSPDKALTNAATLLTSKSTSIDQMTGNFKVFDQTMRAFLQKYGSLSNDELTAKLSTCLPKTLYEDHVFELLPNLKLVEIDTVLNASNYLVLLTNNKTEILPIIGLDVYDSNSFLPQSKKVTKDKKENEGQLLVLLGHTASVRGHKPKVKVIRLSSTLQSDSIVDLTDTVVPTMYGEGTAKFAPNQKDIELSISLLGRGQELNLFSPLQLKSSLPIDNEALYEQLIWQNDSYTLRGQGGNSKLYALFALTSTLKNHNKLPRFHSYLSNNARKMIEQAPAVSSEQGFTIKAYRGGKKAATTGSIYELRDNSTRIIAELRPGTKKTGGQSWFINSVSIAGIAAPPPDTLVTTTTNIKTETTQPAIIETPKLIENKPAPEVESSQALKSKEATQEIKTPQVVNEAKESTQGMEGSFVPDLKTYVKVRSGPGTSFQSVQDIKPNTTITIIGKDNGWYKVKADNKEGYVFAGLVNNHKNGGYINKTTKQNSLVKDEEQHPIGNIGAGEHLILLSGLKNDSYKVMRSNGKTGYISKEAIDGGSVHTGAALPAAHNSSAVQPAAHVSTVPAVVNTNSELAAAHTSSTPTSHPKTIPAHGSRPQSHRHNAPNTPPPFVP